MYPVDGKQIWLMKELAFFKICYRNVMRNLDFNFRFNLVVLKMLKFVIQNKLAKNLRQGNGDQT